MAYLNFKISNIYSPNDFKVQYKESNNVGSLTDGFTDYNGVFSGGTTNIVVSGVTLNFSSTYWIKILDLLNDSFIIENVLTNSLAYYYNFCPPEPTPTVTPTMTVTPTPSVTPEVSPIPPVTPSVTVTVTPSQPLVPVTPTVTPTITPTASPVVGYYYKRFVDCNNNYCYMTLATYNYNVSYNGLVLTVGNKYDYQGTIYTYVDDIVLYTNSPSCLLGNITLVTPYVINYNGYYENPDPLHPNGGTLVYIDECGVQQTIPYIYVTENCQQVTVLSVISHLGLTINCL